MLTNQWDLKKIWLRLIRELHQAANDKYIVLDTKMQFLKKAIDRF